MNRFLVILSVLLIACSAQKKNSTPDTNAVEFNERAIDLMQRLEYDSALVMVNKAIEVDSDYFLAYRNKVIILDYLKDYKNALILSKKLIVKYPDYVDAYSQVGLYFDLLGDSLNAKDYYNKGISRYERLLKEPIGPSLKDTNTLNTRRIMKAGLQMISGNEKEGKKDLLKLKENCSDSLFLRYINESILLDRQTYLKQLAQKKNDR